MAKYKHIGYYNDYEDCTHIFGESPERILERVKAGFGSYHKVDNPEDDTKIDDSEFQPDSLFMQKTADNQYLVRYERGNHNTKDGWYIDIYQLDDEPEEECMEFMIQEYCPECKEVVTIPDTLKVHKCPNCGKAIAPCSICPMKEPAFAKQKNCQACPLAAQCKIVNDPGCQYGVMNSVGEMTSKFNSMSTDERMVGIKFVVVNADKQAIQLRMYYLYKENHIMITHNSFNGTGVMVSGEHITPAKVASAIAYITGIHTDEVYL